MTEKPAAPPPIRLPASPASTTPSTADGDLAQQARPGFGVPSQDPRPEAQQMLQPAEADREARSALAGGGVMVGVAAGAAIGTAVAGPVGAVVGGTLGAVAGALGGAAVGGMVNADDAGGGLQTAPTERPTPVH